MVQSALVAVQLRRDAAWVGLAIPAAIVWPTVRDTRRQYARQHTRQRRLATNLVERALMPAGGPTCLCLLFYPPFFDRPNDIHDHHTPDARDKATRQPGVGIVLAAGRGCHVWVPVPRRDVGLWYRGLAGDESGRRHGAVAAEHPALVPAVGRTVLAVARVVVVAVCPSGGPVKQ